VKGKMVHILGITPARGGSKGLPGKNIKDLCGKPLIAWTIEAAKKSKLINKYVVSTEDKKIAEISRKFGAEIILRPKRLASDTSTTWSVIKHVLKKIDADVVVLLQCTSPIRDDDLIDRCITKFLKAGADSLATGYQCKILEWGKYFSRRQKLKGFFHDDGNVYVIKSKLIKEDRIWGKKMVQFYVDTDYTFEIDDEFDFWLNEQILKRRLGLI